MSGPIAIRARSLGKAFRIYGQPVDRLFELFTRKPRHSVFVALHGVDLEIGRGETVGIVGRNGSGKSTLLQLIAGTLQPTRGTVEVHGRIAALLELGSGFNPEFTGRENVFLNGQVMGLRRHEVEERLERIEQFADIGTFIDQPVRTYSSGMLVRLAFAVAINTDPDILIIDEALAVGDEAFQRKCFARLEDIKARGATILFVSHAAASVVNLCDRAILLDNGEMLMAGRPKNVIALYQRLLHAGADDRDHLRDDIRRIAEDPPEDESAEPDGVARSIEPIGERSGPVETAPIGEWPVELAERFDAAFVPESTVDYLPAGAAISDAHVVSAAGKRVNVLLPGRPYAFRYRVRFQTGAGAVEFGMTIKSIDGIVLFGMSSHGRGGFIPRVEAGDEIDVEFRFATRFQPGTYFFNAGCQAIADDTGTRDYLHRILDVACFRIEGTETDRYMLGFYDLSEEPAVSWSRSAAPSQSGFEHG